MDKHYETLLKIVMAFHGQQKLQGGSEKVNQKKKERLFCLFVGWVFWLSFCVFPLPPALNYLFQYAI